MNIVKDITTMLIKTSLITDFIKNDFTYNKR
jgi:hypothetical protein